GMSQHHPSTRRMRQLKADFQDQCRAADEPCWMDGQPIDYTVPAGSTDDSYELDHYYPASTHPEHYDDPANFRASHALCNRTRSNQAPSADLGAPSRQWA
ncbi:MAG TPA: hypothetical protein VD789_13365, partial [Thermomicrobiales bacterium]|nr:hypothetical protein [Thermomicrobiales bacterium]